MIVTRTRGSLAFAVAWCTRHRETNPRARFEIRTTIAAFLEFSSGSRSLDDLLNVDSWQIVGDIASLANFVDYQDVFEFCLEIVMP